MKLPLRPQIALLSALISGAVILTFGMAAWYLLYEQRMQGVDTEIRALGSRHPGWLANRANFERFNNSAEFIFGEEHQGQAIMMVKDADGQVLYVSPGWPKALSPERIDCSLPVDLKVQAQPSPRGGGRGFGGGGPGRGGGQVVFNRIPRFFTARTERSTWRIGIMGNDDLRLAVGLNFDAVQAELRWMRNVFLLTLPVALLVVGAGGWWVAGRALRPLKAITRTAEHVTARGLDQRIPTSNSDPEISKLIQVLNGMMDRLEGSFLQATRFSADASHELKTPLAILQGELENAIQSSKAGSGEQQVFVNLLEQAQQLKRITGGLLLLAQADAGQLKIGLEEVPFSDDLAVMIEDAQAMAADSRIQFQVDVPPGLKIRADRGLLRMALMNLITNAVRYNHPGGSVSLHVVTGPEITLTICNTGPGIPAADQPRIFERFYRVTQHSGSRTREGLGLGLSLAREIILAHQGRLTLKESRSGHTCFATVLKFDPSSGS